MKKIIFLALCAICVTPFIANAQSQNGAKATIVMKDALVVTLPEDIDPKVGNSEPFRDLGKDGNSKLKFASFLLQADLPNNEKSVGVVDITKVLTIVIINYDSKEAKAVLKKGNKVVIRRLTKSELKKAELSSYSEVLKSYTKSAYYLTDEKYYEIGGSKEDNDDEIIQSRSRR